MGFGTKGKIMRKRMWLLVVLCLLPAMGVAQEVRWEQVPELLRPGKMMRLQYAAMEGENASIAVVDEQGRVVLNLVGSASGSFTWDGGGVDAGTYTLRVTCGGESDQRQVVIGDPAPVLEIVDAPAIATTGWDVTLHRTLPGVLTLTLDDGRELLREAVDAGTSTVHWDGLVDGSYLPNAQREMTFRLIDATGFISTPCVTSVLIDNPMPAHDVAPHSPDDVSGVTCDHDICYWKLNMGETDEHLVWEVLTQPITVLEGSEREQEKVRREPDEACTDYTGEVTYRSQAVHVLDKGEEWTLIEAYSSSVQGSAVANFSGQFMGYVKTSLLREQPVSQDIGLVIDKLQQRLYIYRQGHLYSTLLCSTGYPQSDTPYNETPAGEYITISWTGGFWSGDLYCDMGIRINDGNLLHEVPCLISYDANGAEVRDYSRCSRYLGEKASHGCIRIQRELSPENVNIKWLWDNLPRGSAAPAKVLMWDDATRTLAPADDDFTLYYNPDGGRQYHGDPYCALVNNRFLPLTAFPYAQLEEAPYSKLTRCPGCTPQLRKAEVERVNQKTPK